MRNRAVFTIVQNEPVFLPLWLRYYGRYFEPCDIYVLDHDSIDRSTEGVDARYNLLGVHRDESFDHEWLKNTVAAFQTFLLHSYENVLFARSMSSSSRIRTPTRAWMTTSHDSETASPAVPASTSSTTRTKSRRSASMSPSWRNASTGTLLACSASRCWPRYRCRGVSDSTMKVGLSNGAKGGVGGADGFVCYDERSEGSSGDEPPASTESSETCSRPRTRISCSSTCTAWTTDTA